LLWRYAACRKQRKLFRRLYPHGANTTEAGLRRAVKAGLSIEWLEQFIPPAADKAYYRARISAGIAYDRAIARAWQGQADSVSRKICAEARDAFYERVAPALAKALRGVKA
jgi:hypothetical protein